MSMEKENLLELIFDYFQRTMVHYALWYNEVKEQLGDEKAQEIMKQASKLSFEIQMKRISKTLEIPMEGGYPKALLDLSEEKLEKLKEAMAINWLANDGVWFQSVEFSENMIAAKSCNDAAWSHFSPFEALRIKAILGLEKKPGLEGLKKALQYRLYATINEQSIQNELPNSFDFYMNKCRVQLARKKKGLADYPCKSAGIIEYTTFAKTIDERIQTEVIGCPPDPHPKEWFCGWRFTLKEK